MTDSLAAGIIAVQAESGGILSVRVIGRQEGRELRELARAGDPAAKRMLWTVSHAVQKIEEAARCGPALCATCPRPLTGNKFALVVVTPDRDNAVNELTLAICERCGTSRAEIEAAAIRKLRSFWPKGRVIEIHPQEGRA